ncbi:MAG: ATP-grasp domain-containing protein [Peptococcaceae bacterium]|jgi:predicted ATP-grasp superfamily ATP-dependent carboligase|nr:ATP-grasp domain-containing protein [Peptococcaceae bacterium]MDH7523979.1 ATP-grasp domain-containing protein [Peptococcaceae bacterium]
MGKRVLLTDGQPRKTLAAVRSLGKKGLEVLAAETTRFAPALFSKYCKKALVYPDPKNKQDQFFGWLVKTLRDYQCDVCIPMDDATLKVIMDHKDELESICRFVLPPVESYRIAADKELSVLAAQRAGLLCPDTIAPGNLEELDDIANRLDFPVIIKPRNSSGSRGICLAEEKKVFADTYLHVHRKYPYPIVQKYIFPTQKYGLCLLFNKDSELRASYVYKPIRLYPVDIGSSTIQESVYYPELIDLAMTFMKKLEWFGPIEFEFMVDRQGRIYFIEVNPRLWASLNTAILAGVDFPWLLYRLAMEGDVEEVHTYITGLMGRWLLPGDILHFIANKDRFKMDPPFLAGKKRNVHDDILSWDDPLPTLGFVLACLRYLPDLQMWKEVLGRGLKRKNK